MQNEVYLTIGTRLGDAKDVWAAICETLICLDLSRRVNVWFKEDGFVLTFYILKLIPLDACGAG